MGRPHVIAVVTGASSRLGSAIARDLAARSYSIVAVGRDRHAATAALAAHGVPQPRIVSADLTRPEGRETLDKAIAELPSVEVLVNAVGAFSGGSVSDVPPGRFDEIVQQNLCAPYAAIHATIEPLKQSRGSIVNVASLLGLTTIPDTLAAAYMAAKAGVVQLSRGLAVELAPYRVRVNCVCPGILSPVTGYGDAMRIGTYTAARQIQRLSTIDETAAAVTFLATCESPWITGAVMEADGGAMTSR
ncbi:MAG TPA: SDR family oxidoreductase [Thermoanaerobaculia bacterium]|nr:SDR family oxidoreductase [Thermoanaerobaculia bacterium]